MPKIFNFDEGALREAMNRIKAGTDAGSVDQRPAFDLLEHADVVARVADCRKAEAYARAMEAHGFVWWPPERVPVNVGSAAAGLPHEGQWRNARAKMAFTPTDLLAQFLTPEDFDRWATGKKLERQLMANRSVSKAERRVALQRASRRS